MQSSDFIESGIIFSLDTKQALGKFKYTASDFQKHGDAYKFINNYLDKYGEFPSVKVLCENYPTLDSAAQRLNLDYALDVFQKQILFRQIVGAFQANKELVSVEPNRNVNFLYISSCIADVKLSALSTTSRVKANQSPTGPIHS